MGSRRAKELCVASGAFVDLAGVDLVSGPQERFELTTTNRSNSERTEAVPRLGTGRSPVPSHS